MNKYSKSIKVNKPTNKNIKFLNKLNNYFILYLDTNVKKIFRISRLFRR